MLTVYRASAGAGKTHKLTGDYLMLLFAHPYAYRRILAVTFTNKATEEMKVRIIEALYQLGTGKPTSYVQELREVYSLTEKQVRDQAGRTLVAILHDYSAFNISTIDRFFQQTMRAFTREIGLQGGYGIEMDRDLVLTETVDRLLANLEKPESKELLGWLLRFAEDKIENGGEWNLRREIMILASEVFKESYKAFSEEVNKDIADKQALDAYRNELQAIIRTTEGEAKRLGEQGQRLLYQYELQPSDFRDGKRTLANYFEKLTKGDMKYPSNTFIGLADNLDGFLAKGASEATRDKISQVFGEGLNDCVRGVLALFSNLTFYHTAKEISRYYYTLGILADISYQIAIYREEKNVMLITDTTELLNKVIDGSDAPFIYEKTGTAIDHYMIDEFQDTSGMQWENFLPLIRESLAQEKKNLIVGDVKQSIYRFRNSDWELLDQQVQKDFSPAQLREETLKENWRSARSIVEFNNAFFTNAPELLQTLYNQSLDTSSLNDEERGGFATKITSAYQHTAQLIPPPFRDKSGHVRIQFLGREGEDETKDWKELALAQLPEIIERLQENGYPLKDIAILTRTNNEAAMVAETLLTYKEEHPSGRYLYDIISDDALFVNSSSAVRFFIALLRYLKNPDDRTQAAMAHFSYQVFTRQMNFPETGFPSALEAELLSLSRLSLYETVEGLYRLFAPCQASSEQVFVQAFLDMVAEFTQKESADLSRFLLWWDETGYKKTIATPDNQNAIRILTVHKSKGLGFKVVILPFGDWEIDHKPTKQVVLWCHPVETPFNRLHLVPVRYGQVLAQTIFAADYFNEKLHASIDNLNTLYVAFTRAKEELIVFAPRPKKVNEHTGEAEKISSIADLLWAGLLQQIPVTREGEALVSLPTAFDWQEGVFELGEWWHPEPAEKKAVDAMEISIEQLASVSPDNRLRLRLHAKDFLFDNKQRKHGALMHEVLSKIRTTEDIVASVEGYRFAGIINREESDTLIDRLTDLLNKEEVSAWYDGKARILNEVDILFGKGFSMRPDRVMISGENAVVVDYKFGGKEDRRYHGQVRNYLKLINQMGYSHVRGFLWYVELNKIEEVIL